MSWNHVADLQAIDDQMMEMDSRFIPMKCDFCGKESDENEVDTLSGSQDQICWECVKGMTIQDILVHYNVLDKNIEKPELATESMVEIIALLIKHS